MKKSKRRAKDKRKDTFKLAMELTAILISLAAFFCTLYFNHAQNTLNMMAEKRESREQPLSYSVTPVQGNYAYHISYQGKTYQFPAPSFAVVIHAGELESVSAIAYTGNGYKVLGTFQPRLESNEYCVKVDAEAQRSPMVDDLITYDYFFLYLQPVSGTPILDLICTQIDLEAETVTPRVYHHIDLLTQTSDLPAVSADMLAVYSHLYTQIMALPTISGK